MNETKDLIIGIDFGKEYSQICYYDLTPIVSDSGESDK